MKRDDQKPALSQRLHKHHVFMWTYAAELVQAFTRPAFVFLIFLTMSVIGVSSLLVYAMGTDHFSTDTFLDSFYFVVTTMTGVGFGDHGPVSSAGKIVTILFMLTGTAIFASFTATLAMTIFEIDSRISKVRDR